MLLPSSPIMASTLLKSLLLLSSLYLSLSTSSALNLNTSSTSLSPNILLQSLQSAISQGLNLSHLLSNARLVEAQRGAIQDCKELHQITLSSLQESISIIAEGDSSKLPDAGASLSAVLTNKMTCLEGLAFASGASKAALERALVSFYEPVRRSLSMLPMPNLSACRHTRWRRFPVWLSAEARGVLLSSGVVDRSKVLTVAADGTGNFTTISGAINFAPNKSADRIVIHVRKGVYRENVKIPSWKTNIFLMGDGRDATVISGSRSFGKGWTTFSSATVAVMGKGFLARGIKFENTAGPASHQAVALLIHADKTAVYRCAMTGYQDTLYAHGFRQYYRECDIYGTIDYIFGHAAAVFQGCNIVSRLPLPGQFVAITAHSRDDPTQDTGISIQGCRILATDELKSSSVRSYLGRPWRNYSRTVYMGSYIDGYIEAEGWIKWRGDQGLDTLYYGEYANHGPGSSTAKRVAWPGYHVMRRSEACKYTVSALIRGNEWLDSTHFPYNDGV